MDFRPNLHLFYAADLNEDLMPIKLSEEETYHATKVLRYLKGDIITVTNGKGLMAECLINSIIGKKTELKIIKTIHSEPLINKLHLAVSPVKNREKNEWLIEKATEIGVNEISFFISGRSERSTINFDRLEKITISAIKQSLNPYKPVLNPLKKFENLLKKFESNPGFKFIASCETTTDQFLLKFLNKPSDTIILIGPEGDFKEEEIKSAVDFGFIPVNLGGNRLRSETAAIYAITLIKASQIL